MFCMRGVVKLATWEHRNTGTPENNPDLINAHPQNTIR